MRARFGRFAMAVSLTALLFVLSGPLLALGAPVFTAAVKARLPHDPAAFTQGLLYHDGFFFESTGLYGQSSLRRLDAATGKISWTDLPEVPVALATGLDGSVWVALGVGDRLAKVPPKG